MIRSCRHQYLLFIPKSKPRNILLQFALFYRDVKYGCLWAYFIIQSIFSKYDAEKIRLERSFLAWVTLNLSISPILFITLCGNRRHIWSVYFSKKSWFNIIDEKLIKCDIVLVIKYLKLLLTDIINILKDQKGNNLCMKYFSEENMYAYLFNNMKLLKDLKLDTFLLELFLLL